MHDAGYVQSGTSSTTSHLDINILSILQNLESPLGIIMQIKNENDFPPFFKINYAMISDKQTIAQEFNAYFKYACPTLANDIVTPLHKSFHDYLTAPSTANLSFDYVSETNIAKIIKKYPPNLVVGTITYLLNY